MTVTKRQISEVMREMGKRGGPARAKKLTKKELAAIGRKGAEVTNRKRWGTKRKKKARKSLDGQAKDADTVGEAARETAA